MPDREAIDRQRRYQALALAVEHHRRGGPTKDVLFTATEFLAWLRHPTPAATLTLRASSPIPK